MYITTQKRTPINNKMFSILYALILIQTIYYILLKQTLSGNKTFYTTFIISSVIQYMRQKF